MTDARDGWMDDARDASKAASLVVEKVAWMVGQSVSMDEL